MGAETYKQKKEMTSRKANTHRRKSRSRSKSRGILLKASVFVGIAVIVLGAIFFLNTRGGSSSGSGGLGTMCSRWAVQVLASKLHPFT